MVSTRQSTYPTRRRPRSFRSTPRAKSWARMMMRPASPTATLERLPADSRFSFIAPAPWWGKVGMGGRGRDGRREPRLTPPLPLSAVGFLKVVIMPMFLPSCLSLSLLPPEASRGLGQRQPRPGWGRRLRHRDRWPGFRDEAAQGQRRLVEQGHQDQVPAPAKDTDQPQAGGPPGPRWCGEQDGDVWDRAGRDRLLRLPPTLSSHK